MNATLIATAEKSEFMLLFRNTELEKRLSPPQMEEAMQRLNQWLGRWKDSGHLQSGQPLADGGKVISGGKNRAVAGGPFAESKEAVGGYVLLRAADLDEAMQIAGDWPLLDYECLVEVRPVRQQCATMDSVGMKLVDLNA